MEEKIFFNGEFGKICGVLNRVKNSNEIAIIVHGFSSNKNTSSAICSRELESIEVSSLRIDLDNQGESELDFRKYVSIPNYVSQIESSIKYCKNLGFNRISLIGTSFGGISAFATALNHSEIEKMVLRAPVVDFQRHLRKRFGEKKLKSFKKKGYFTFTRDSGETYDINFDCYTSSSNFSMIDRTKEIKIPVLYLQGDKDNRLDWQLAEKVIDFFPNATLKIIKGAGHNLGVNGDFSEGWRDIRRFFQT